MIFNGNATVYSACSVCRRTIQIVNADDRTHPTCAGDVDPPATSVRQGLLTTIMAGDRESTRLTAAQMAKDTQRSLATSAKFDAGYCRWPVFPLKAVGCKCKGGDKCQPLCQCPKTPATKNGFKDASTDRDRIARFWESMPNNNIGLATGVAFDVIDIDAKHPEGIASFTKLLTQQRLPEIHGIAVTATGGLHLYTKPARQYVVREGNRGGFMPGLDYRGPGGYVVAPPSTLTTGWVADSCNMWQWIVPPSPELIGK
jgi:hypothetical protein